VSRSKKPSAPTIEEPAVLKKSNTEDAQDAKTPSLEKEIASQDRGEEKGEANAPDSNQNGDSPEEVSENDDDKGAKGIPEKDTEPNDSKWKKWRKFSSAALFNIDQGVSAFTGPGTWIGGGVEVSFRLLPELFLQAAFFAQGGAFPRDKADVSGTRLIPEIGATYFFVLGFVGLGPEIRVAPCRTAVKISETEHLTMENKWWVFRASFGPAMRLPIEKRVSFYLNVLFSIYAKGKRIVRSDEEQAEVYKTPIAELTARVGIFLLI
jgi:hypothetical protein